LTSPDRWQANWRCDWQPEASSAEARLYTDFLIEKDWV
jgi:coproporphyrinogen III oxidase